MMRTKLLELLFSFSKGNLEELMDFARLRSLNLQEWHLEVLDYFCNLRIKRNIREEKYQKDYIIKKVFPNSAEIKKDWYDINSKLVEVVNRFILYRNIDFRTPSVATELARYYFENKLEKCFEAQRNSISKYFQANKNRTFKFYFKKYDFLNLELVNNKSVKGNSNIRLSIETLDKGYIENRLWLMCEELMRKKIWHRFFNNQFSKSTSPQYNDSIFDAIWSIIKDMEFDDIVISYLQTLYTMLLKDNFDKEIILKLYDKRIMLFEKCEKWRARTLLDYLRHLFRHGLNEGHEIYATYYVELLDLYRKNNAFIESKQLPSGVFKNAVTTALIAGKIEWSDEFVEQYSKYVPENVTKYSLAQIYLEKGNIKKAYDLLPDFPAHETFFYIGSKRLSLKIYYQKGNYFAIHSMLPSFKDYVKSRNNLPVHSQNKIFAFIKYLNKLIENKTDFDISKIKSELAASDMIWVKKMIKNKGSNRGYSPPN